MTNASVPQQPQNQDEGAPIMGLYLDRPPWKIDPKGFSACNNVRIELGRVRSDLIGWSASTVPQLPAAYVYTANFVDRFQNQTQIGVTPTDIIFLAPGGTNIYMTPVYNSGTVSINNGSPTLTGVGTRWNTDIQFGDHATANGTFVAGTTKIYFTASFSTVLPGVIVTDLTNRGAVNPGTYLASSGTDGGGFFIILSQPLIGTITNGDTVQLGSGIVLRNNLRPGDQIYLGSTTQNSITATWYTVLTVNSDTSITLTTNYSGTNLSAVAYTGRQLLTNTLSGNAPLLPSCASNTYPAAGGFNAGDLWFFTNGVDPVVIYSTGYTTSCLYARSISFVCAALKQKQGLQIFAGLTFPGGVVLGTSIASSDNGFPLQLSGGVSFQGIASDGPFSITRIGILGSTVMLYCSGRWGSAPDALDDASGSVISASFVGFPTIWAFSDVIRTRGPVCGNAVVEFADRHQFLSLDGMYRYNGLFIQVMNDHIWRAVMKNFDFTRPGACFAFVVPSFGDLLWVIPQLTDPTGQVYASTAFVEHYMEQANSYLFKPYTVRDFPFTCAGGFQNAIAQTFASLGTTTWNQLVQPWSSLVAGKDQPQYLAGDINGNLRTLYTSNTQNGTPVLATVTWAARVIGNARARPLVTRVYPSIEYLTTPLSMVTVTLALADALAGPPTISDVQSFNPSYSGNRFTTHYRRGRLASVTLSDTVGLGWICDGYDWDVGPGGGLR